MEIAQRDAAGEVLGEHAVEAHEEAAGLGGEAGDVAAAGQVVEAADALEPAAHGADRLGQGREQIVEGARRAGEGGLGRRGGSEHGCDLGGTASDLHLGEMVKSALLACWAARMAELPSAV